MVQDYPLPDGWKMTTLGDVTLPVAKLFPQQKPNDSFIYLDISSIDNKNHIIIEPKTYLGKDAPSRARQLVKKDDILFSTVRTYLENVALVPDQYDGQIASTGFSILRAREYVLPKFLFYHCLTNNFLEPLNELQRGTSYPAVRDNDVRIQPIPLAPLPEQERIVAKIEELFTQLDAGVAALRRVQAELKRYKASVLKAACEGRLVPQDPSDEPAEELLRRMGKTPLVGDGLPSLPEGWCWTKIEDITETIGGVTKGRDLSGKETIRLPYLRVANVQRGCLVLGEMKEIEALVSEVEKYRLKDGDLVLTEGGDWDKLGRSAIWGNEIPNCIHQNHIFRARVKSLDISPEWLMYYTNSELGQSYFKEAAKQTTNLASINLTQLRACPIPLLPLAEQKRIVAEVERRLSVATEVEAAVEATLARSARLRQAVLKRAFEGKLVDRDLYNETTSTFFERIQIINKKKPEQLPFHFSGEF